MLCWYQQCWLRHVWADQSEETRGRDLKETGAKIECFRGKGTVLDNMSQLLWFLSFEACELIPVETQNKIMQLKMSTVCPL